MPLAWLRVHLTSRHLSAWVGLKDSDFPLSHSSYRGDLSLDGSILEEVGRVHGLRLFQTCAAYHLAARPIPASGCGHLCVFTIGLSAFEVPAIIGMSNKIFTFSTFIFYKMQPLEELPNYGVAGAVSSLLVVLALVLSWWYFKVLRFLHVHAVVTGRAYHPDCRAWWQGRICAWIFLGFFFLVAKVLPFLLLVWVALLNYFPAAILGGIKTSVAAQLLRAAVGSHVRRRAKHLAFDVGGADPDVDFLSGDIVGDSSIGVKVAGRV